MKKSQRTVVFIALLTGLLWGCRKPTASDVSGTYSQPVNGAYQVLHLHTNGSYQHVYSTFGGKAFKLHTNPVGTWTFNPRQSLVFLTNIYLETSAYVFDDGGTQVSLLRTSTPAMPMARTTATIGTNVVAITSPDAQPFYRRTGK